MSKRIQILENSLVKKKQELQRRFDVHFDTVKQANGQPLNDKRNGQATLNKWENQNNAIRNSIASVEKTKNAIETEKDKIAGIEAVNKDLPKEILALVSSGELIQWRKHPHTFFVPGVDKGRIVWLKKTKQLAHKFLSEIKDQEQRRQFAKTYNDLNRVLTKKTE